MWIVFSYVGILLFVVLVAGLAVFGDEITKWLDARRDRRELPKWEVSDLAKAASYEHELEMLPHTDPDVKKACGRCKAAYEEKRLHDLAKLGVLKPRPSPQTVLTLNEAREMEYQNALEVSRRYRGCQDFDTETFTVYDGSGNAISTHKQCIPLDPVDHDIVRM